MESGKAKKACQHSLRRKAAVRESLGGIRYVCQAFGTINAVLLSLQIFQVEASETGGCNRHAVAVWHMAIDCQYL